MPDALKDLRINDCGMSVFHTEQLFQAFDKRIFLKTLGLSGAKFNE